MSDPTDAARLRDALIRAMELFDAPRFSSVGGIENTCNFQVDRDQWETWAAAARDVLEYIAHEPAVRAVAPAGAPEPDVLNEVGLRHALEEVLYVAEEIGHRAKLEGLVEDAVCAYVEAVRQEQVLRAAAPRDAPRVP